MATLLDSDQLAYLSFPIVKFDKTDDGDLLVWGRATDGSVDADQQIVDPAWSAKALDTWLATGGNVRVMHSAQHLPAGKGVEVDSSQGDGTWVRSLVVEPTAKRLVEKGVLQAYSVGIANPKVVRDAVAKGGRIVGGEIHELSLVDRPANKNCGITLVKSAAGTVGEEVAELFGDYAALLADAEVTKSHGLSEPAEDDEPSDENDLDEATDEPDAGPDGAEDESDDSDDEDDARKVYSRERAAWLAREPHPDYGDTPANGTAFLVKQAAQAQARKAWAAWSGEGDEFGYADPDAGYQRWLGKRDMDPDVGGGVDRDALNASHFVDPKRRRFPIVTPGDVSDAVHSFGRADPPIPLDKFRHRLTAIAHRLGPEFVAELPQSWGDKDDVATVDVAKNITLTLPDPDGLVPYNLAGGAVKAAKKCPKCGAEHHADSKLRRCEECGAKLPKADKGAAADLVKVGPKGYEHGWIYVGPQAAGARVVHHLHGEGTVTRSGKRTVGIRFDSGHEASFEHGRRSRSANHFKERGPKSGSRSTRKPTEKPDTLTHPPFDTGASGDHHSTVTPRKPTGDAIHIAEAMHATKPGMAPRYSLQSVHDLTHNDLESLTPTQHRQIAAALRRAMSLDQPHEIRDDAHDLFTRLYGDLGIGEFTHAIKTFDGGNTVNKGHKSPLPADVKPAGEHREPDGDAVEALEHDAGMHTDPDPVHDDTPESVKGDEGKPFPGAAPPFGSKSATPYQVKRMHDALCAAYPWSTVTGTYPSLGTVADAIVPGWFGEQVTAAANKGDMARVVALAGSATEADLIAKGGIDPAVLADGRAEVHKAFADTYPNVTVHPSHITPGQFQRPYISAGHAPLSAGAAAAKPNVPPSTRVPDPNDFDRPLITAGHEADSPSNRGGNNPVGSVATGSARALYAEASKAAARTAMQAMHDHIAGVSPDMCPMAPSRAVMPPSNGATNVPTPVTTLPETYRAPGEVGKTTGLTPKAVRKLIKSAVVTATKAVRDEYEDTINDLREEVDKLGAQPDPAQAPLRGVVRKADTGGTDLAPVERISLVEQAQAAAAQQQQEEVAFAAKFLNHPDPAKRAVAEQYVRKVLTPQS